MTKIIRAQVFHTPQSPFDTQEALVSFPNGAVAFEDGVILDVGDYTKISQNFPKAEIIDEREAILLPGFIDTHVHYPQVPIIGSLGMELLEWLEKRTLPEESKLVDSSYARQVAKDFLRSLLRNGTTTALVFGTHFAKSQDIFFKEANVLGLNIISGLVLSDKNIPEVLQTTPEKAYRESRILINRWHKQGRLQYAVMPRFSVSCSERLLKVCGQLLDEYSSIMFHTHLNENNKEIDFVSKLFPWSKDYLHTYEHFGLVNNHSVFAHNVHVSDSELKRLARARAAVAHCPSSNMFLGSGLFDMKRHLKHKVTFALGSDVGAGTGFSLLKEGLMSYQGQMLHKDGYPLAAAHLLYLSTKAGAEALNMVDEVGDLQVGKKADFVIIEPLQDSTLAKVLAHSPLAEASLGALFTLAREGCVKSVFVSGQPQYNRACAVDVLTAS